MVATRQVLLTRRGGGSKRGNSSPKKGRRQDTRRAIDEMRDLRYVEKMRANYMRAKYNIWGGIANKVQENAKRGHANAVQETSQKGNAMEGERRAKTINPRNVTERECDGGGGVELR